MIQNSLIIKANNFLVKLAFFALPFRNEITSVCVFFMFFISLYDITKNKTNIFKRLNFTILFFFLYFTIDLIGIFYSENKIFGIKDLESKLFFLVVPVIFLSNKFKKEIIYKALKYFIIGTTLTLMIHYWFGINYFIKYISIPNYVYFSFFIHPTYFSIYLLFSVILLFYLKRNLYFSVEWIYYLLLITLSIGIILTNSKAGTSIFIIYIFIHSVNFLLKQKKIYLLISIPSIIIISTLVFQKLEITRFSELKTSINFPVQTEYNGYYNSTQNRIIIWRTSKEIIINKPFFGTGTGDIKDELKKEFIKKKFLNGIADEYNCHNQFLQIIATFGFILGGIIIAIFLCSVYEEFKNKNFVLIFFILIISFNSVFESVYENKAGIEAIVLFYLIFSCLNNNYNLENSRNLI